MTRKGRLAAPAKLNPVLRVLARETSGYHQIETLLVAVDLCDQVEVSEVDGDEVRLVVEGDVGGALGGENLVTRAAQGFRGRCREEVGGLEIRLSKRIPVAAGLGGGSSDAAATLRVLAALYPDALRATELRRLAAELGSDVPFFLSASPWAWAWGRGTRSLSLEPPPPNPVVIAVPVRGVSTVEAYGLLGSLSEHRSAEPAALTLQDLERWEALARNRENDFEAALYPSRPDLAALGRAFEQSGALLSGMTGSGAAHFGVFETGAAADAAARALAALDPTVRVLRAESLTEWPRPSLAD
ncbi:MAG: 4-(cytidine 5'-diphospho)-2-C-methyl-D-erythritol kinase [Gemmatimonadota bacterium]